MSIEKYLFLKAEKHNCSLVKKGDWRYVVWQIYSDRSYSVEIETIDFTPVTKSFKGRMSPARFKILQYAIQQKPWRDSGIECCACDGVMWAINEYSNKEEVVYTTGKTNYIYGHNNLERIVSALPYTGRCFDAGAYVTIRRKD